MHEHQRRANVAHDVDDGRLGGVKAADLARTGDDRFHLVVVHQRGHARQERPTVRHHALSGPKADDAIDALIHRGIQQGGRPAQVGAEDIQRFGDHPFLEQLVHDLLLVELLQRAIGDVRAAASTVGAQVGQDYVEAAIGQQPGQVRITGLAIAQAVEQQHRAAMRNLRRRLEDPGIDDGLVGHGDFAIG